MKFMITWRLHPEKRHEAFETFSAMSDADDAADMGDEIELIGRWHDLQQFKGVAICETSDPHSLAAWLLNWNSVLDVEAVPVLDDAEARAVGRKMFG